MIATILAILISIGIIFSMAEQKKKKKELDEEIRLAADTAYDNVEEPAERAAEEAAEDPAEATAKEPEEYDHQAASLFTRRLMFDALTSIGCQPQNNDDGTLSVSYQGENFHIDFNGMYANIWDPFWAQARIDDPSLPIIREAVNIANFNYGPTVVMTKPNEDGVISIHSRKDIMLHPTCPDNILYIHAVLNSFFDAKESVYANNRELTAQQAQKQASRRPIGFATSSPDTDTSPDTDRQ